MEYVYSNKNGRISGSKRIIKSRRNKRKQILHNIVILVIILLTINIFFNVSLAKETLNIKTLTVRSGTTLWNIANKICENNPDLKIQNVILEIKELNNMQDSIIYEGQKLLIYEY